MRGMIQTVKSEMKCAIHARAVHWRSQIQVLMGAFG